MCLFLICWSARILRPTQRPYKAAPCTALATVTLHHPTKLKLLVADLLPTMDSTVKYQLICFYLVFFALVQARPSTKGEMKFYGNFVKLLLIVSFSDKIGNITTTLTASNPLFRKMSPLTESPLHELSRGTTDECRRQGGYCVSVAECPAGKSAATGGICGDGKTCCHTRESNLVLCWLVLNELNATIGSPSREKKWRARSPAGRPNLANSSGEWKNSVTIPFFIRWTWKLYCRFFKHSAIVWDWA